MAPVSPPALPDASCFPCTCPACLRCRRAGVRGGLRDYVGLFATRPHGMPRGVCFPAGHSSAGFAWVSLYFFALPVRPAWRWRGLAVGLVAGCVFGAAQQLRGAHFLSHDLWTLATCWTVSLLFLLVRRITAREVRA